MNQWELFENASSLGADPIAVGLRDEFAWLRELQTPYKPSHISKPNLSQALVGSRARELAAISGHDWRYLTEADCREARLELAGAFVKDDQQS